MATGVPDEDSRSREELISMWVSPAVRGRGVAAALITAVAHWAASTGASMLALSVMPDNVAARRTNERNGFIVSCGPAICYQVAGASWSCSATSARNATPATRRKPQECR
ncbi:GNAT superfamily N-acetyltransferase [Arthrobacter sp. B3I9]|nr:GNAT superfamily N-acetyltransferase [Arthrobacter sp. B3I9]